MDQCQHDNTDVLPICLQPFPNVGQKIKWCPNGMPLYKSMPYEEVIYNEKKSLFNRNVDEESKYIKTNHERYSGYFD